MTKQGIYAYAHQNKGSLPRFVLLALYAQVTTCYQMSSSVSLFSKNGTFQVASGKAMRGGDGSDNGNRDNQGEKDG